MQTNVMTATVLTMESAIAQSWDSLLRVANTPDDEPMSIDAFGARCPRSVPWMANLSSVPGMPISELAICERGSGIVGPREAANPKGTCCGSVASSRVTLATRSDGFSSKKWSF